MEIILAPAPIPAQVDLFLAGGISNCPDWQTEMSNDLQDTDWVVLNPRRPIYDDSVYAEEQITWEFEALHKSRIVSFWFPEETLCPITLFELGVFSQKPDVEVHVGTHPNYARRFDVITQMKLARPEIMVVSALEELISQVKNQHA